MSTSQTPRVAVLVGLAVVYAAAYVGSGRPSGSDTRLDPMTPEVRAVERALSDGRLDEAEALARTLAARHHDDPFATFLVATAHHHRQQWTDEAAAWTRYLAQSSSVDAACPDLAVAYERAGDAERALAGYRQCAERDAANPDRLADLAAALARRNRAEDARRLYDRALALDPANPLLLTAKAALP